MLVTSGRPCWRAVAAIQASADTYGRPPTTCSVGRFGPPEAHGAVKGMDNEVAQVLLHPFAASLAPVTFECPPVELGDRHKGDYRESAGQVGTVGFCPRGAFEKVGYDGGVYDRCRGRDRGRLQKLSRRPGSRGATHGARRRTRPDARPPARSRRVRHRSRR